jgi:hypothetical protein
MSADADVDADAPPSSRSYVRTTVTLREDLYQRLKDAPQGLSAALNAILAKEFQRDHALFGTARRMKTDDLRDHRDRV